MDGSQVSLRLRAWDTIEAVLGKVRMADSGFGKDDKIEVEVVYIDSESMEGKLEPPSNTVADFHFMERFKLKHQKTTLTIQPMRPLNKRNRRQLVMVDSTDTGRDIKNKLDV